MGGSAGIGAVQGIQSWMRAFDRSASAVSGAAAQFGSGASNQTGSTADLIDGMIGMRLAGAGLKANIAVFRTADEMLGSLLDMKA
jgi:flagellar hook protein FlgE